MTPVAEAKRARYPERRMQLCQQICSKVQTKKIKISLIE